MEEAFVSIIINLSLSLQFNQCTMMKTRLFRKGSYLAVLAEDGGFWLCWTKRDVFLESDTLQVVWLEKVRFLEQD